LALNPQRLEYFAMTSPAGPRIGVLFSALMSWTRLPAAHREREGVHPRILGADPTSTLG
jgi:hypothetical protein